MQPRACCTSNVKLSSALTLEFVETWKFSWFNSEHVALEYMFFQPRVGQPRYDVVVIVGQPRVLDLLWRKRASGNVCVADEVTVPKQEITVQERMIYFCFERSEIVDEPEAIITSAKKLPKFHLLEFKIMLHTDKQRIVLQRFECLTRDYHSREDSESRLQIVGIDERRAKDLVFADRDLSNCYASANEDTPGNEFRLSMEKIKNFEKQKPNGLPFVGFCLDTSHPHNRIRERKRLRRVLVRRSVAST